MAQRRAFLDARVLISKSLPEKAKIRDTEPTDWLKLRAKCYLDYWWSFKAR